MWDFYGKNKNPIDIIQKHIYVNCKTDVAVKITKRILGIRNEKYGSWADKHIVKYDIQANLNKHLDKEQK